MKLQLKDFQAEKVDELYRKGALLARDARDENEAGSADARLAHRLGQDGHGDRLDGTRLEGDADREPDEDACFLWITDSPELNEQSRQKVLAASTVFLADDVVTIDASFDRETFEAGKLYFLNTQKVGREKYLSTEGDKRDFTIWETITNTIGRAPSSFWVIIDEAHKGMTLNRNERRAAQTIVQKFLLGSPGEIPAIPLVLGISATPQRFIDLLAGGDRNLRQVNVGPEDVRASGLLKDDVIIFHPS